MDATRVLIASAKADGAPLPVISMLHTIGSLAGRVYEQFDYRMNGIGSKTPPVEAEQANLLYRDEDTIILGVGKKIKVYSVKDSRVTKVKNSGSVYMPHYDDWNTDYMRYSCTETDIFGDTSYHVDAIELNAFRIAEDKAIFIGFHMPSGSWFVYNGWQR